MLELKKLCLTANDENGKTEILKNYTKLSAILGNASVFHLLQTFPADCDRSAGRIQFFHQKLDQCGFTGATASYYKYEFPFINM